MTIPVGQSGEFPRALLLRKRGTYMYMHNYVYMYIYIIYIICICRGIVGVVQSQIQLIILTYINYIF